MKTLAFLLILSSCQIVKAPLVYCLGGKYSVIINEEKTPSYAVNGEKNTGADVVLEDHSFTDQEIIFSLKIDNQAEAMKVQTHKNEIGSYAGKIQFNGEELDASCSLQELKN